MRKIALLLVMSMMLSAAACGKEADTQAKDDSVKTEVNVDDEVKDDSEDKAIDETLDNKEDKTGNKTEDKTENKEDTKTDKKEEIKVEDKLDKTEDNTAGNKGNLLSDDVAVEGSVAQILLSDFKSKVKDKKDPQKLADALLANKVIKFSGATMVVEPGPLNGFDADIKGFKKGVMFSPMIGTIPFVGYIFTVSDGGDVNKFVDTLKKNANKRWNICTEADEMVVSSVGNTVFFVMSPTKFEE